MKWILSNGITLCIDCHHKEHGYKQFKGNAIISENNNKRSIRIKKKCSNCSKNLFIVPSGLILTSGKSKGKKKKHFYCDKSCMSDHYKVIRLGKNNPRNQLRY